MSKASVIAPAIIAAALFAEGVYASLDTSYKRRDTELAVVVGKPTVRQEYFVISDVAPINIPLPLTVVQEPAVYVKCMHGIYRVEDKKRYDQHFVNDKILLSYEGNGLDHLVE